MVWEGPTVSDHVNLPHLFFFFSSLFYFDEPSLPLLSFCVLRSCSAGVLTSKKLHLSRDHQSIISLIYIQQVMHWRYSTLQKHCLSFRCPHSQLKSYKTKINLFPFISRDILGKYELMYLIGIFLWCRGLLVPSQKIPTQSTRQ